VSSVNLHTREIAIKVVYYGPGLGGKTSSLYFIHRALRPDSRGQLVSLATGADRTLYFDFLPVKLPKLRGFAVRVQLYTVPGQVHYNSTRKLVLTGADGLVFVADSQRDRMSANMESLENATENLREQGRMLRSMPFVIQYNKRDLPNPVPVGELEAALNTVKVPSFETVATNGTGVFEALKTITKQILGDLSKKGSLGQSPGPLAASPDVEPAEAAPPPTLAIDRSASRRPSVPPTVPPGSSEVISLSSLGEVADAIDKLSAPSLRSSSGVHKLPTATPARALSDLIESTTAREAIVSIETDIDRGEWAIAVRRAGAAFYELSARLAGSLSGTQQGEAPAVAALLTALPAARYLRFREAEERVRSGGAVTSSDALFALFFLTDFALRTEELRKGPA
jgi:signal recognition particle receptor subunit beta